VQPITDDSFDRAVFASELPVLVDFRAAWCPPCRALAPVIEELAGEHQGKLKVLKLDVDENPKTAARFRNHLAESLPDKDASVEALDSRPS
jgi:thioredoxin 1